MPSEWEFVYALPNLLLSETTAIDLGSPHVALVGGEHPSVIELRNEQRGVNQVLGAFRDEYGNPYSPAVILVQRAAPNALRTSAAAFNDFRNAVAMSVLLRGRSALMSGMKGLDPTWADTFDFHPAQLNKAGSVVLQSPALLNAVGDETIYLTTSPAVSVFSFPLRTDGYLHRCFAKEWRRRYIRPARNEQFSRTLFRSLEVAYYATSAPVKSGGSANEYGVQVALWVSAMEILAWPAQRHADLPAVLDLLERAPASRQLLSKRYSVTWRGRSRRANAIQRCYSQLYDARNRFLHGNHATFNTLMAPARKTRVGLPRFAALVYRYALVGFLVARYPKSLAMRHLERDILESIDDDGYHATLSDLLGLRA